MIKIARQYFADTADKHAAASQLALLNIRSSPAGSSRLQCCCRPSFFLKAPTPHVRTFAAAVDFGMLPSDGSASDHDSADESLDLHPLN